MLDILYSDGPVLIVNKPSGVLVQAPPGIDSMVEQVKEYVRQKEGKPEDANIYLGVPHRLDRPATGCLVFARHVRAAKRISEQFQMRTVVKKYWILVSGLVPEERGDWEDFIRKVDGEARSEIVTSRNPEGRWALLHYIVKKRLPERNCTWLEIELETGRTHQIRLQTSSRGFPVLGDTLYGSTTPFGVQFEDERLRPIALHSRYIELKHPMRDERISAQAPLPPAWREVLGE